MVLKTAAVDPVNYRRYIFYIFLGLLSTFLTIALAAVVRCCANRAPAKVCFRPGTLRMRRVSHSVFFESGFVASGSGSSILGFIPIPIRIQLKLEKKLQLKFLLYFSHQKLHFIYS
jgi:hypothetical protein